METKSDTPRTDQEEYTIYSAANYGMSDEYADHVVDADFARKLERELAALKTTIKDLEQKTVL